MSSKRERKQREAEQLAEAERFGRLFAVINLKATLLTVRLTVPWELIGLDGPPKKMLDDHLG